MRRILLAFTLVITATGCGGVTFQFGGAPPALHLADTVQRCVQANRIVVRPATAEFESRRNMGNNVVLVTTHQGHGLTFYQGQRRLTAEQALARLGDLDLQANYTGFYKKQLTSGRSSVKTGKWTFGIGVVVELAGMGVMFGGIKKVLENKAILWTGVGIMSVGALVATIGGFIWRAGQKDYDTGLSFQTIFISTQLKPRLLAAVRRYNRNVAVRCGQRPAQPASSGMPAPPANPAQPRLQPQPHRQPAGQPRPLPRPDGHVPPPAD